MKQSSCLPLLPTTPPRNALFTTAAIWSELVRGAIEPSVSPDQCPADPVDADDITRSQVLRRMEPRALMAKDEILTETAVAVSVSTAYRAWVAAA